MTPLERIRTLAAVDSAASVVTVSASGTGGSERGISGSQTSIVAINNNNNNNHHHHHPLPHLQHGIINSNRSLRRSRFSFNGRKPSFSWLSSTSSINSTAPVKGMEVAPSNVTPYADGMDGKQIGKNWIWPFFVKP